MGRALSFKCSNLTLGKKGLKLEEQAAACTNI